MAKPTITVEEPLSLESLSSVTMTRGEFMIGVVKNNVTRAVSGARIQVLYYKGKTIVEESYNWTEPASGTIEPGEKAPFITLFSPDEEWDSCRMLVTAETSPASYYHNPALKLVSHELTVDANVRGEIQNLGTTPVEGIRIAVTGYDEKGNLVAVAECGTRAGTVPAGEGTLFETFIWLGNPDRIETYDLRILSRLE